MKKFKFLFVVAVLYFAGFFTGLCMQNVSAVVRAPGETNQPVSSQTANTNPVPPPSVRQMEPKVQGAQPAQPFVERPPSPPAAADDRGATLYSLSSSMRVDIERLEDDIAILKNKVNILNNMR